MSVFTPVSPEELHAFLLLYDVGALNNYEGINAGIENTNFFVTTDRYPLVLTLFETLSAKELPFFLGLMAHLAEHEVPSAHPLAALDGEYLQHLNGKPAALVRRLMGKDLREPLSIHCRAIGDALAKLHNAASDFAMFKASNRGYAWWCETRDSLQSHLEAEDLELLNREILFQHTYSIERLPKGIIHADLFRDNALFVGNELTGIIDFYYACNGTLLYDLAVTVNDWCFLPNGDLDARKYDTLIQAYHAQRPLSKLEDDAWPAMLRAAALRFWLSRLYDKTFPRPGEITHIKDPNVFRNILLFHIENTSHLPVKTL